MTGPPLPADCHVHTEWSWDAVAGSMEETCARALELGLPSVSFTEHVDMTRWVIAPAARATMTLAHLVGDDGRFNPPSFDAEGYLASIDRCRARFPDLRIVTGVELGEPHWFAPEVDKLLSGGDFERLLGSQHAIPVDGEPWIVTSLEGVGAPPGMSPDEIVRAHLRETLEMVLTCDRFAILAHIDYAARAWPAGPDRFPASDFEDEIRGILDALAASGRTLEVNTARPLEAEIVGWWRDAGGETVSFGSDAHRPATLARSFRDVMAMVEAQGFRPAQGPHDVWRR